MKIITRIAVWYCNRKKIYCESCGRLRADVKWRNETEQYECQECYQWYLDHG